MSATAFQYTATDGNGSQRRGVMKAADRRDAYRQLSSSGLTPIRIDPVRERRSLISIRRVSKASVAALTRELNVLVQAKIPTAQGLASIAQHESNPELKRVIEDIASQIEAGSSISESMGRHPSVFGDAYIQTLRAAEASGSLGEVTAHLADMLEQQIESAKAMRRALSYPIVVIGAVVLALGVILLVVVPKFERMFASSGVELPLATRVLQGLGNFVNAYWWAILLFAGVGSIAFRAWVRTRAGRLAFEAFLLRVPYVRAVIITTTAGRFSRVFAIATASGLGIIESMRLAGRSSGRPLFAAECDAMAERLGQGDRVGEVLASSRYLPPFARRLLSAGRDSEELVRASNIVAEHFDRESSHLTKNVSSIIEPILTIMLAVVVLVVALAVFLPMWQMVSVNK